MLTSIKIQGFKSLENVTLNLGNLNIFIGTNASGKSNFLDALRVLQGIGYGLTIDEIFNGKPKSASSEVWEPIRGGSSKANFVRRGESNSNIEEKIIRFSVTIKLPNYDDYLIRYSIGISPQLGCVRSEKFEVRDTTIFNSEPLPNPPTSPVLEVRYYRGKQERPPHVQFQKNRPVLHQFLRDSLRDSHALGEVSESHLNSIDQCISALSNAQGFDPYPAILRDYSKAHTVKRMGDRGENFAALVKTIVADENQKLAFLSWLKELTPTELDDILVLEGALGEPLFALKDNGITYPAPILSDGTLRFAAITAALFQPDMPDIITIEEIENGIHPARLRLLLELLKSQSKYEPMQIIATTHSPILLEWLTQEDYQTTFICKRDEETGATRIVSLAEISQLLKLAPMKHPIGELLAEGWFEGVL